MSSGRMTEAMIGVAGNAAGAVADPRQGLRRLRSARSARVLAVTAAGLLVGYLLRRRRG